MWALPIPTTFENVDQTFIVLGKHNKICLYIIIVSKLHIIIINKKYTILYDTVILSKYCLAVCKMSIFIAIIWFYVIIIQKYGVNKRQKIGEKIKWKEFFAVVICAVMIVSTTACTGSNKGDNVESSAEIVNSTVSNDEEFAGRV